MKRRLHFFGIEGDFYTFSHRSNHTDSIYYPRLNKDTGIVSCTCKHGQYRMEVTRPLITQTDLLCEHCKDVQDWWRKHGKSNI